jgi:hypothetical protein
MVKAGASSGVIAKPFELWRGEVSMGDVRAGLLSLRCLRELLSGHQDVSIQ